MKSAMQNVLDLVQKRLNEFDGLNGFEATMMKQELNWFKDILTNKLEKEKEQLNVSFISGAIEALSSSTPVRDRIKDGYFENKAEQYFEYTYKINKL
jgi:hypothetical protein